MKALAQQHRPVFSFDMLCKDRCTGWLLTRVLLCKLGTRCKLPYVSSIMYCVIPIQVMPPILECCNRRDTYIHNILWVVASEPFLLRHLDKNWLHCAHQNERGRCLQISSRR